MSKHFLIDSLENGLSLISENSHREAISALQNALNSNLLAGVDVTSPGLPKGEQALALTPDDGFWPSPQSWMAQFRPYVVKNSTLFIPVRGVLLHGVTLNYGRYFTGYDYVMRATMRGKNDPEVRNVLYHVDSNGGHVASCFDTCDSVAEIGKPTVALIADFANSAGYAIAASCDKVVATQTVLCGNIGVLRTHIDSTKMLDNIGVKYEYISAPEGGDKSDGFPGTKVTDGMRERGQAEVEEIYEIFVKAVTRKRKISAQAVRDTKAHTFQKEASLKLGLIDKVVSSVDMLAVASELFASDSFNSGEEDDRTLSHDDGKEVQTEDQKDGMKMTEEEMRAEIAAKTVAAKNEGATEAKARIGDILALPEAKGREALAQHFAFKTDMDVDSAKAALAVVPVVAENPAPHQESKKDEAKDELKTSFDKEMQKNAPNLSANSETGADNMEDKTAKSMSASKSLAARAGIGGYRAAERQ